MKKFLSYSIIISFIALIPNSTISQSARREKAHKNPEKANNSKIDELKVLMEAYKLCYRIDQNGKESQIAHTTTDLYQGKIETFEMDPLSGSVDITPDENKLIGRHCKLLKKVLDEQLAIYLGKYVKK